MTEQQQISSCTRKRGEEVTDIECTTVRNFAAALAILDIAAIPMIPFRARLVWFAVLESALTLVTKVKQKGELWLLMKTNYVDLLVEGCNSIVPEPFTPAAQ